MSTINSLFFLLDICNSPFSIHLISKSYSKGVELIFIRFFLRCDNSVNSPEIYFPMSLPKMLFSISKNKQNNKKTCFKGYFISKLRAKYFPTVHQERYFINGSLKGNKNLLFFFHIIFLYYFCFCCHSCTVSLIDIFTNGVFFFRIFKTIIKVSGFLSQMG